MKEDYQCRRYCEGERGDADYTLTSELLFHGSEMVTAPVRSKTAKRKREDNTTALKKQKQLAALKDKISAKSWNMLNCHRKDRKKASETAFQKIEYETLESSFPRFHQSRIDLESQNDKRTLVRNVDGEILAIDGWDEHPINETHLRLLLDQVKRPNYYHAAK